jgi:hypothetical protein
MQARSFFMGLHQTPKSVKWLIALTLFTSILAPIITFFLEHYLHLPGPSVWFSLSLFGLKQGWLFQPLTYFFLQTAGIGISVSLLISLAFYMFLLWFAGSEIDFRFGTKGFLLLYFSAGILSGIIAALFLFLFSSQAVLVGSGPCINALMIILAMIYPDLELYFFFIIRIKAKWLIASYLLLALVINLSYAQFIPFLADLTGIIWGFLVGHFVWKLPNPYPLNLAFPKRKQKKKSADKIIDISVFQENDEAFMDRMLDKIAKRGEISLTKRERERMHKISERKRKDN